MTRTGCYVVNLPFLIIEGIPYFYRQFGYEFAIPLRDSLIISMDVIPSLKNGESEPFRIVRVTKDLFQEYLNLRAKRNALLDLYRKIDHQNWQYISQGKLGEVGAMELYLIKHRENIIGSFYIDVLFEKLEIKELWVESEDCIPTILRHCVKIARSKNIPLGAIYCIKPTVERYSRLAPKVKSRSGAAVTGAHPIKSRSSLKLTRNIEPAPMESR